MKKLSGILNLLIFIFAFAVYVLAFYLLGGGFEGSTDSQLFVWISGLVVLLLLFVDNFIFPFGIKRRDADTIIIGLTFSLVGMWFYILPSIVIAVLLLMDVIALNLAIILQCVAFIILLISIFYATFTTEHIAEVAINQKRDLQILSDVKMEATKIKLLLSKIDGISNSDQRKFERILEDISYLSATGTRSAENLEMDILSILDKMRSLCLDGSDTGAITSSFEKLSSLVELRKLERRN